MKERNIVSEMLKEAIGKKIVFFNNLGFRFQGKLLACDEKFFSYEDRITGVRICALDSVKEVQIDS